MFLKLFLAFTLIPVVEIYLLMEVAEAIGSLNAIMLVLGTGFLGAYFARMQGMQTMFRVRASLQQGIVPAEDMVDALLIFVAGIVLITPGLMTDLAGLLILFPGTRQQLKRFLKRKFEEFKNDGTIDINHHQ